MDDLALRLAAARGWPATETEQAGGWLLRATPGLDRARSNGALALRADPDLDVLEAWYATRGLRAAVQVEPLDGLGELDEQLDARGYLAHTAADVLVADVGAVGEPDRPVALLERPTARWAQAWGRAEEREEADVAAHVDLVLAPLEGRAAYAFGAGGAAVGVAVRDPEEPVVGLFSLATAPAARGRGEGTAVLRALVAWGREAGAQRAYLQVLRDNPAQALYRRHGFRRAHGYHHRRQP